MTKIKNIKYDNFEMKSYLLTNEKTTSMKKIVFRAQTRMLPVGFIFGEKYLALHVKHQMTQTDTF